MRKLPDRIILDISVLLSAAVLTLIIYNLGLSHQVDPLGVWSGAIYLVLSVQSYGYYASMVLEGKRTLVQFLVLIAAKVGLLAMIFVYGSPADVMGLFCAICLVVPASLALILARKLPCGRVSP